MSKARSFLKYWLPVLIWMVVIFSASADTSSTKRSSRIIGPILRWLFPDISEDVVMVIVTVVRKCAHLAEYALLATLFWRALRKPVKHDPRPWSWRNAGWSVLFVAAYAVTDELHQAFVPNRFGSAKDVVLDTVGAAGGMLLLWALSKWRGRRAAEVRSSGKGRQ